MRACLAVVAASVLLFGALQLNMPAGFVSIRGLNPRAVAAWQAWLGGHGPGMSLDLYGVLFRGLLVTAWLAYAGALWMVVRGVPVTPRWGWPLAGPLVLALAFGMPASLSTDVFAYVGYGRLAVVHGLNPHLHTQAELIALGDPTSPYLNWPIPSPYGPLWTLLSMAAVWFAPAGSVLVPVIALKVFAGGALLATGAAFRSLVRRRDPLRADSVFALVALNPLLLIEGPGNGHNDLLMMAIFAGALAALGAGRMRLSPLLVGVASAVKLVPVVAVPWLMALAVRHATAAMKSRLAAAVSVLCFAAVPLVAAYAPFWAGAKTLSGLGERWRHGQMSEPTPARTGAPADRGAPPPSSSSQTADPADPPAGPVVTILRLSKRLIVQAWPALIVYLWASLAIALGRGDPVFRLGTVWAAVALAITLFVAGMWFPWYLAWIWPVVVARFTAPHRALALFLVPFSLLLMLGYAMAPG